MPRDTLLPTPAARQSSAPRARHAATGLLAALTALAGCAPHRPGGEPSGSGAEPTGRTPQPTGSGAESTTSGADPSGGAGPSSSASQPATQPATRDRAPSGSGPCSTASSPRSSSDADDEAAVDRALAEAEADVAKGAHALRPIAGCTELDGAGGCTGAGAVMLLCQGLGNVLDETATRRLVACLTALRGTDALCSVSVVQRCGLEAIDGHRSPPAVAALCDALLRRCELPRSLADVVTRARCLSGLGALRERSRDEAVACLQRSCDLRLCLGGLL